jgi:hypothetical protein
MTRTDEQIVARINSFGRFDDFFGAKRSRLIEVLSFDAAKDNGFAVIDATEEEWAKMQEAGATTDSAASYLEFAAGKAANHRGLSAARSIDHFDSIVWLVGDAEYEEFDSADSGNYGCGKLRAAAKVLGLSHQWDELVKADPDLERMANGLPCYEGCDEGCGS